MALCEHGYTLNFDCPVCPCPCGSGEAAGECRCTDETHGDAPVVASERGDA